MAQAGGIDPSVFKMLHDTVNMSNHVTKYHLVMQVAQAGGSDPGMFDSLHAGLAMYIIYTVLTWLQVAQAGRQRPEHV